MYLAPACTFWLLLGSCALEMRRIVGSGAHLLVVGCCAASCGPAEPAAAAAALPASPPKPAPATRPA